MNKEEMETNPSNTVPLLGSARGLVAMQPGWDEAMSPDEVEEVFYLSDGTPDALHDRTSRHTAADVRRSVSTTSKSST